MTREGKRFSACLAVAAILVVVPYGVGAGAPGPGTSHRLAQLNSALTLDQLSAELWPDWEISGTSLVLIDGEQCWLLGDGEQMDGFESTRVIEPVDISIHTAPLEDEAIARRSGTVAGAPAAFINGSELSVCVIPTVFEAAFKAHLQTSCAELGEPVDPLVGFPSSPRAVALADIEREIVLAALSAPRDSLEALVRDFVSIRGFRRAGMTRRFVSSERSREYRDGIAAYVRLRARDMAVDYVGDELKALLSPAVKDTFCLRSWLCKPTGLDWYRNDRFACMGAAVCYLLDGLGTDWRGQATGDCVDPYAVLWMQFMGGTVDVAPLLGRYGFEERQILAAVFIDETKSGPEKLFDEITRGEHPLFIINTEQLARTTVSYDREYIAKVDAHRDVHKRILNIEFSGGTHVYIRGRQTAAVVGESEFDFHQLIFEAPDGYEIRVDGVPFTPAPGINHLTGPLSVTAMGLEIEAVDAIIVASEGRLSFVLHR